MSKKQDDNIPKTTAPLHTHIPDTAYRAGVKELNNWEDNTQVTHTQAEQSVQAFLQKKQGE